MPLSNISVIPVCFCRGFHDVVMKRAEEEVCFAASESNHDCQTRKIVLRSLHPRVGVPMKWFVAVVCLFFLAVLPTQADSLVGPAYNVVGSVTFSGNNACGGVCSETLDFSFVFQWVDTTGVFGPGIYGSYIPGSFSATQSGSMGSAPITSPNDGHIYCCGPGTYIPLNAFNGELDLDVSLFGTGPDPGPPTVFGAFLFSCSNECFNEFAPRIGVNEAYPATYTATAVPEPSGVALLAGAMLLLAAVRPSFRRRKQ